MPTADRPNPSFFVVEIRDPSRVGPVSASLGQMLDGQGGRALIPLANGEYALARPLSKRLRLSRTPAELEQFLRRQPGVTGARRLGADELRRALESKRRSEAENDACEPGAREPGQAEIPEDQWNLLTVKADQAWAKAPGAWRGGVRVGHIDTGYTRHPVLGFDGETDSGFILADQGIDYVDSGGAGGPRDPLDYSGQPGHGTRTLSVLAGDVRRVFLGVAPGVSVVPYRITKSVVIDTLGNDTQLDAAIRHAVIDSACKVINISLGDPCFPRQAVGEAVDTAYDNGVIIVAAAGNITSEVVYPARYARTVGVGGITRDDVPWAGGSRGERVDICAPADEITRADARLGDDDLPVYDYADCGDGTSYAAVHVSAGAALWLAHRGDEIERTYAAPWQRVEAFRRCLKQSARRPQGWDTAQFGAGILDLAALLDEPLPAPEALAYDGRKAADERV